MRLIPLALIKTYTAKIMMYTAASSLTQIVSAAKMYIGRYFFDS